MISGTSSKKLASIPLPDHVCEKCQNKNSTEVLISAGYFHVFWIPALSTGKEGSMKCKICSHTTEAEKMPSKAITLYEEHKKSYKTPWYHWSLSAILAVLIGISFLFSVTGNAEVDLREAKLNADLEALDKNEAQGNVGLAVLNTCKAKLDVQFEPAQFMVLSRTDQNKLLLLIKAPNYNLLKEDQQADLKTALLDLLEQHEDLKGKELYFGLLSKSDVKYAKTPTAEEEGAYMASLALYEYYGKKELKRPIER